MRLHQVLEPIKMALLSSSAEFCPNDQNLGHFNFFDAMLVLRYLQLTYIVKVHTLSYFCDSVSL